MTLATAIQGLHDKLGSAGVKLAPALTDREVVDYERLHCIQLPGDYREFLLQLGNGSAGSPNYGLCALGTVPSDFNSPPPDISKAFPFTKAWVWEDGDTSAEGTFEQVYCGVLILGTDGCGQYWALVVNGPDFGKIWLLADVGIAPVLPRITFLEWYAPWIQGKSDWWK
jgi:hypothetical protein